MVEVAVIGVDPGTTCGVALYVAGAIREAVQCDYQRAVDEYVIPWLTEFPQVVCSVERYTVSQRTLRASRQPVAQHVIGVIKRECDRLDRTFVQYGPGDAKKLGNAQLLRRLGWYTPGQDHVNDAKSHILLTLARVHRGEFVHLVGPGMFEVQ